jgi:hypothetical protein
MRVSPVRTDPPFATTLVAMMTVHAAATRQAWGLLWRAPGTVRTVGLACPGRRFGPSSCAGQLRPGVGEPGRGFRSQASLGHYGSIGERKDLLTLDSIPREESIGSVVVNDDDDDDDDANVPLDLDDETDEGEEDGQPSPLWSPFVPGSTPGSTDGFFVVKAYSTDPRGFDMGRVKTLVDGGDLLRLGLTAANVSVPVALMLADGDEYPSISRARKACRKANIMIHRGGLGTDPDTGKEILDASRCIRARVGDRVFPGDVIAKQVRMGDGYFPVMSHKKPPFDLPVVFEDDHFAIGTTEDDVVLFVSCSLCQSLKLCLLPLILFVSF